MHKTSLIPPESQRTHPLTDQQLISSTCYEVCADVLHQTSLSKQNLIVSCDAALLVCAYTSEPTVLLI